MKSRGGMPFGEIYGSGKIILLDLLFSKGIKTFVALKCKCGVSFKTYHGQVFVEMASAQKKRKIGPDHLFLIILSTLFSINQKRKNYDR
jgi:hypothetical protein